MYISDRAKEIVSTLPTLSQNPPTDLLRPFARTPPQIVRGGENISTVSVENALYRDERIKDAAVVPVPDAHLGELVA